MTGEKRPNYPELTPSNKGLYDIIFQEVTSFWWQSNSTSISKYS